MLLFLNQGKNRLISCRRVNGCWTKHYLASSVYLCEDEIQMFKEKTKSQRTNVRKTFDWTEATVFLFSMQKSNHFCCFSNILLCTLDRYDCPQRYFFAKPIFMKHRMNSHKMSFLQSSRPYWMFSFEFESYSIIYSIIHTFEAKY